MASYRQFLKVLEKWPVDKTKGERDLGLLLRRLVKEKFPTGEGTKVDEKEWAKHLTSLNNISSNLHQNKNPVSKDFQSATGLTAEECQLALSREFLETLQKENKGGFFKRVLGKKE